MGELARIILSISKQNRWMKSNGINSSQYTQLFWVSHFTWFVTLSRTASVSEWVWILFEFKWRRPYGHTYRGKLEANGSLISHGLPLLGTSIDINRYAIRSTNNLHHRKELTPYFLSHCMLLNSSLYPSTPHTSRAYIGSRLISCWNYLTISVFSPSNPWEIATKTNGRLPQIESIPQ